MSYLTKRLGRYSVMMLLGILAISLARPTLAGPVTSVGSAPFSRLSLYEGVIGIVPAGGAGVLELGYRGEEIAGSADIYLRPGSVTQANGARVCANCGSGVNQSYANLLVPGQLCLYGPSGSVADCRTTWPTGGAGSSAWDYVTDNNLFGMPTQYVQLNSANQERAIHIGSAANPVSGIALDIDSYEGVIVRNANAGGKAVSVQGNAVFFNARVKQQIKVNGQPVYDTENSGRGSGLDADTLNGNNFTIEPASLCVDNGVYRRVACLCLEVKEGASFIKKCTPLANRPF